MMSTGLYYGDEEMDIDAGVFTSRLEKFADENTRETVVDSALYVENSAQKAIMVYFSRKAINQLLGSNLPNDPTDRADVVGLTLTFGLQPNNLTLNLMARCADENGACPLPNDNYAMPNEASPNNNPINNTKLVERRENFRAKGYAVLRDQTSGEFVFSNQILFNLLYEGSAIINGISKFYYGINTDPADDHLNIVGWNGLEEEAGGVYQEGKPCPPNCYG